MQKIKYFLTNIALSNQNVNKKTLINLNVKMSSAKFSNSNTTFEMDLMDPFIENQHKERVYFNL